MLEIVYAEKNEQFLWENSEQFYLIKKTNLIVVKFKHEKAFRFGV